MKQTGKEKKEQRAKNKLALTKSWYKKIKNTRTNYTKLVSSAKAADMVNGIIVNGVLKKPWKDLYIYA